MRQLIQLREKRAGLVEDCRAIVDRADTEKRDLTKTESDKFTRLEAEIKILAADIARREKLEAEERHLRQPAPGSDPPRNTPEPDDGQYRAGELRTLGRGEVRVLNPDQRISDCPEVRGGLPDGIRPDELNLGRVVRAIVTGDWRDAQAESRAMGVGSDSGGGFLLPDVMGAQVIDLSRNKAKVFAAGARTVPMESNKLTLAKVTADPTAGWKAENAAGTASDVTLGAVNLSAKTLFAETKVSVELVEDAGNVEELINDGLSSALALKLDLAALRGEGEPVAPLGIRNTPGVTIDDMGVNGALITNYDKLSRAVVTIVTANGPDTGLAAIYAPRTWGTLDRFVDGQGQPQTPPASVAALRRLVTNQVPIDLTHGTSTAATEIYVGDFSQLLMGMRTSVVIEASRVASDTTESAFHNLQVWIRAYLRADVAIAKPDHFVVIDGINFGG